VEPKTTTKNGIAVCSLVQLSQQAVYMGISSRLFSWLHRSRFYFQFHQEAARLLEPGSGETWIDFGCGPGVLTRLAAKRGYKALGLDLDQDMLRVAQQLTPEDYGASVEFRQFDLFRSADHIPKAKVVSASSFLPVFGDKKAVLQRLLHFVADGGSLLLIETNENCTPPNAFELFMADMSLSEAGLLLLGMVRNGKSRSISAIKEHFRNQAISKHTLSNGMVDAFIIRKGKWQTLDKK
jgi:ubiquinone/menaquinone biosynthesis C-methylase UbiE